MRVLLYRLLAFRVPQHCFQEDLLYDLPRHRGETDRPVAPGVFLPFVKMGVILPFFHSPGTPPDCHDFSDVTESDLETTSANSLRTLWENLAPMGFLNYPQKSRRRGFIFLYSNKEGIPPWGLTKDGILQNPFYPAFRSHCPFLLSSVAEVRGGCRLPGPPKVPPCV